MNSRRLFCFCFLFLIKCCLAAGQDSLSSKAWSYAFSKEERIRLAEASLAGRASSFHPHIKEARQYPQKISNQRGCSVGEIPLIDGVSSTGARTYDIPISTAVGYKLSPNITLSYNSQTGDGIAGIGWDISGISSIRLINKNQYYHGESRAADASDTSAVFALDGEPLVLNDSISQVPYVLTTPRSRVLIRTEHNAQGFVKRFFALYPDGRRAVFGHGLDLGYNLPCYPLTEMTDLIGNKISYSYSIDTLNANDRIQAIRYGYDPENDYHAELEFRYTSRTPSPEIFFAGKSNRISHRLVSIESRVEGALLGRYSLSYELSNSDYLLSQVECDNSEGESLPPVEFEYGESYQEPPVLSPSLYEESSLLLQSAFIGVTPVCKRGKFQPNSFNDGLLIYPEGTTYDCTFQFLSMYQFGSPYPSAQKILFVPVLDDISFVDSTLVAESGFQTIEAVDVDGDGVDEIVKVNLDGVENLKSKLKITTYKCNGAGHPEQQSSFTVVLNGMIQNGIFSSPYRYTYHWGDFNGDGRIELLTVAFDKNYNSVYDASQTCYAALIDIASGIKTSDEVLFTYTYAVRNCLFTCDLDNDSRTELCFATDSGLDIYRRSSSGAFVRQETLTVIDEDILSSETQPWYLTDLNGDGYPDIVQSPAVYGASATWNAYLFNGKSFVSHPIAIRPRGVDDVFFFIDLNRDALADLVVAHGTSLTSYINQDGVSFGSYQHSSCVTSGATGMLPMRVTNFNDASAFIKVDGFYVRRYGYYPIIPEKRLLTTVTDSYGKLLVNTYAFLPDKVRSWYEPNLTPDISKGYASYTPPIYVLRYEDCYKSMEDAGSYRSIAYWYINGVAHNLGLGFRGFNKLYTAEYHIPGGAYTEILLSPEKMGVVKRVDKRIGSFASTLYSTVTNTWDDHSTPYGKLSPRLIQTVIADSLRRVTTTTEYTYDSFDFPVSIVTEHESTDSYKKETVSRTYSHSDTSSFYLLGTVIRECLDLSSSPSPMRLWRNRIEWSLDSLFRPVEKREYSGELVRKMLPPPNPQFPDLPHIPQYVDGSDLVRTTRWTYDSFGNVSSEKNAPYDATEFLGDTLVYDSAGRFVLSKTDALGHTTSYSGYNKFGMPAAVTDYRGRAKTFSYDSWGNLLQTGYADGSVKTISREWTDGSWSTGTYGHMTRSIYAVSSTITGKPSRIVHYDALGREVHSGDQRFDGQWRWTDRQYDLDGRLARVSLPYKTATATATSPAASLWNTYSYDSYDRVTSIAEASGRTTTWSYSGTSTTTVKDGISSTTTTDAAGNVISVTDAGGTITYTLRDDGQPSSVTAPGNVVTTFSYDGYGRRVGMDDPSVGARSYSYIWNSDGSSQTTQSGPNGTITTSKDKYGRTTSVARAGEFTTTYSYDTYGKLVSESSTNGTSTTYAYDTLDRVVSVREDIPDGKWLKRDYAYGAGSNVASILYTSQTDTITTEHYSYAYGHNKEILLPDSTVVFRLNFENDLGQPTWIKTGEVSRQYGYNAYGLPTLRKMVVGAGGPLTYIQDFAYSFNAMTGNLTARSDDENGTDETLEYDSLGRLVHASTTVRRAVTSRSFSFEDNGNLTYISSVGTISYDDPDSPYKATSKTNPAYITTPIPRQTIAYNSCDRQVSVSQDGITATLTYNGAEDRVKMAVVDSTGTVPATLLTRYYLGGRYEIDVEPGAGGGTTTTERFYLGGDAYSAPMVLVRACGSGSWTAYNIGRDYLGSITLITTADGTPVAEYSYDPWGRMRNPANLTIYNVGSEPALFLSRGYTGHEFLPWFSLYNMNARLYDPLVGRFLSPDPYVQAPDFTQNFNRYSYCLNNPLKYSDESGEFYIIDSFLIGFFTGLSENGLGGAFEEGFHRAWMDAKIWGGLFATNPNLSREDRWKEFKSRFSDQLLQTIVGFNVAQAYNTFGISGGVQNVWYKDGATVLQTRDERTAVTLGSYIIGGNSIRPEATNKLFQHEYGHYLQSQEMGGAYLLVVGIPSIVAPSAYQKYITVEQDANIRSLSYFLSTYPDEFIEEGEYNGGWKFDYNPIKAFDSEIYHTAQNQSVLLNPPIQPYIDSETSQKCYHIVFY